MKPAKKAVQKPHKSTTTTKKIGSGLTEEEREAMRERLQESKENGEDAVLAKIAAFAPPDRAMAERLHKLVKANYPGLSSRTWYGMPAYAKDGNVVCFFQSGHKFKTRYATLGFSDKANLDDGSMWPTAFALKEIGLAEEKKIDALLRRAVG